ncbi:hypothetical protein SAMD00023353_2000380 [Rosellinia necatrix]|uniref:Uncharacterized protein n=1 Tax=Rosellinia necatrix TaxID=77044 RepID=A0A1W2TF56_ROSNE|nr:hypothetical protein SAMD00023353_2000380 [Rosellinia necatrix]
MAATFTPPLAALTTVFTPPCPITWLLTTTKVPSQYPPFPTTAPASCDPPSWGEYVTSRGFEYYSPAICPSGFYIGPSCIVEKPRTAEGFPTIAAGETAAYCIPNGHVCTSDITDFRGGVWGVLRTDSDVIGPQVTVGPAIQIRWREGDLDALETDPLTPGPKVTTIINLVPGGSITSAPETTTQPPSTSETSTSTRAAPPEIPIIRTNPKESETTTTRVETSSSPRPSKTTSTTTRISTSLPESFSSGSTFSTITGSSTSPFSEAPTPTTSQGGQAQNGTGDGPRQFGTSNNDNNNNNNNMPPTLTVAATVLTTVLIVLIVGYSAYSVWRQYRRYRAGEAEGFFLFEMEARVRRRLHLFSFRLQRGSDSLTSSRSATTTRTRTGGKAGGGDDDDDDDDDDGNDNNGRASGGRRKKRAKWKTPDAELGTEGPLTELAATHSFGTKENPAELPAPERFSWRSRVSRMSRIFTAARASAKRGSVEAVV